MNKLCDIKQLYDIQISGSRNKVLLEHVLDHLLTVISLSCRATMAEMILPMKQKILPRSIQKTFVGFRVKGS